MNLGFCLTMSILLYASRAMIVDIYNYDEATSRLLDATIIAFALYNTPKMMSYVHICGILRAGGDTRFCMACDVIGIWCIAIPLAFLGAAVWKLPLPLVVALSLVMKLSKRSSLYGVSIQKMDSYLNTDQRIPDVIPKVSPNI